jgi:tetratricopeptide (TPR) repeat protein
LVQEKDMQKQDHMKEQTEQLTTDDNDQLRFLLKILQSVSDSNGNEEAVYPLLKKNLALLNEELIEILKTWVDFKFAEVGEYEKRSIIIDTGKLANLILDFPLGNRDINVEFSIACYERLSEVFTVHQSPEIWANTQNNLAIAYSKKTKGNRVENLEKSIRGYESILNFYTKQDSPTDWANIQNNLAIAYSKRIKGNRAENLDKAITCYKSALEIYNKKNFPKDWATTQNNLINTYLDQMKGVKTDNLEYAIMSYKSVLEIYTRKDFPSDWAIVQNNIADAYSKRIDGKGLENLQQAINYYQLALEVFNSKNFPNEWISIQLKLAKLSIEKMLNYQIAMEHLEAAYAHLSINNSDTGLLAQTMFDMARCFHQTGCLDQAKIYFKDAIRIYQRLEQPTEVAVATVALGNLELQMGLTQDAQQHLRTALEFYQAAGQTDHVASIKALQQHLPIKLREIAS